MIYTATMYIRFLPFPSTGSAIQNFNFLRCSIFTETKSTKQESDDDAPLSSYRQPEANKRAPPRPTEAEYLARYLSHRNKQLELDTNTGNNEQHAKSKGDDHKDIASSTQMHCCSNLMPRRKKEKYY